ncbi:MAG: ArsA family ATPase [Deltaproteobacteria bacterium]|nr:ArsA family ATPase [Deltaproteobacteria bacterium]
MNERRTPDAPPYLDALLRAQRVIVCCGAGGVGKTTTAAALGLAAARQGRRVLVLTIDPARRLGEALGLRESGPTPSRVERAGAMDAWMLDPRVVFEDMVRRLTADEAKVQRILQNKLYRALRDLVAGMQEYTAAEALFGFVECGKYDLVVLDTPPSRNALEFLEAPRKLSLFLDERIVGVFMPSEGANVLMRGARSLVGTIFDRVFGEGFLGEVQEFLSAFSGMFSAMRGHSEAVRSLLTGPQASFVVVTSPEPSAIDEGQFLHEHLVKLGLPFAGYVLNRSWAYTRGLSGPETLELPADASEALRAGYQKLCGLADHERQLAARDRALLATLAARGRPAVATPNLGGAIEDFEGLLSLAESFVSRERAPDALTSAS